MTDQIHPNDTTDVIPGLTPIPPATHRKPRRMLRAALTALAVAAALLLGIAIGYNSHQGQVTSLTGQLGAAQHALSQDTAKIGVLQRGYAAEKDAAATAAATADAAALARYAGREAALNARAADLRGKLAAIAAETGELQANQIVSDGIYVVGSDIKPGVWHTPGAGGGSGGQCYWATLNSTNSGNVTNIIANNNFDGPETVDLNGVPVFQITGGCTWYRVSP